MNGMKCKSKAKSTQEGDCGDRAIQQGGIYVDASDVNASMAEALSGVCYEMLETKGRFDVWFRDRRR